MKIASSQREVRVIVAQNQRVAYKLASQEYIHGCTRDQPMPCQGLLLPHQFFKGKFLGTRLEL